MTREIEIQSRPAVAAAPVEVAVIHRAARHEIPVVVLCARPPAREPRPRPAWLHAFVAA